MYGPATSTRPPSSSSYGGGGGGSGRGPPQVRKYTPPGSMSAGANQRPPLTDLPPHLKPMFEPDHPIEWKPLSKKKIYNNNPHHSGLPITGVAKWTDMFEKTPPPLKEPFVPPKQV